MYKLEILPSDTITDIKIYNNLIYISSFDSNIYIYDIWSKKLINKIQNDSSILKMLFNKYIIYSDAQGFITFNGLKKINVNIEGLYVLEQYKNMFIIGGFSKVILLYDNGIFEVLINQKVYGSCLFEDTLALNFGKKVGLVDLRCQKFIKWFKNKYFIRSIFLNKNKLYIGDINGRIHIYYINIVQDYIINAHIAIKNDIKKVYPVNNIICDIDIYSCGSDGIVNRLKEEPKLSNKIIFNGEQSVLKIGKFENFLVVCCGYNYEFGKGDTSFNPIYIITI
ncbi:mitotic checkpoint protein bub3 [Vairimorpha apis BRL 01]|uniref:Mitotic checkpoint protein bub3 n=1 Tax=Vairimorpha apis BRL 01 TaxID=1037528 RepID=T0MFW5_9MICR|nr:mitotic checkpoint protein bub3 [Vairimorpha apis BRL 01]